MNKRHLTLVYTKTCLIARLEIMHSSGEGKEA